MKMEKILTRGIGLLCFLVINEFIECKGSYISDFIPSLTHVVLPKVSEIERKCANEDQLWSTNPTSFYCRSKPCHMATSPCSKIIPRVSWLAREPRSVGSKMDPVSLVFIQHTVMDRCLQPNKCLQAVHKVQDLHMNAFNWDDIGYSFIVGEDGNAYEARGYDRVGAHTFRWNNVSIGIGVMGNYSDDLPNGLALQAINDVIECGIALGKIMPDYKIYGHCDARPMFESPGRKFYNLIKTWPNYGHQMLVRPTH